LRHVSSSEPSSYKTLARGSDNKEYQSEPTHPEEKVEFGALAVNVRRSSAQFDGSYF
jgi:hypothetical protein